MRKILFIGKFNSVFQDINNCLASHFQVQVCIDNLEMIRGILRLKKPDLVVISLIGMNQLHDKIFGELKYNYPRTPVVCIGAQNEQEYFETFLRFEQFRVLTRPVSNDEIMVTICELLRLKYDVGQKKVIEEKEERKCVLLVDDNALQLRALSEMLKESYDVQLATSGMKALTLIGKRVPDVILLDYDMPMCDGKMTLQMIRELEEAKDIPVIFLTGVRDKEHIKAVIELRPAAYLLKPASGEMLLEAIGAQL